VCLCASDERPDFIDVYIDPPRQLRRNRIVERLFCLDVRRWDIEKPQISNFFELFTDPQRRGAVIQSTCTNWLVKTSDGWVPDLKKDPGEWLRDPKMFDQVLTAIVHALMWFKPEGGSAEQFLFYHSIAERIIDEIRSADPSLPITKRSTRQHAMAMLKDKLGDLVRHPHPYDDWRKNKSPVRTSSRVKRKRK